MGTNKRSSRNLLSFHCAVALDLGVDAISRRFFYPQVASLDVKMKEKLMLRSHRDCRASIHVIENLLVLEMRRQLTKSGPIKNSFVSLFSLVQLLMAIN